MAFTLDISGLTAYINENRDLLLSKIATVIDSSKYLQIQTGVTADTAIHGIITDLSIQDGSDCGFNADGEQTISERKLEPNYLKVNAQYCPKDFYGTYMHYQTNVAMGRSELPLEEALVNDIIKSIAVKNENLIWSGVKANDLVDGFTTLFAADTAIPAANKVTSTETTVYDRVKEMYTQISNKDYVMVMAMPLYRQLVMELVAANLFHYDEKDNAEKVLTLPGTSMKVYGIEGIDDTDTNIYGVIWNEMFLGVDGTGDAEQFDFFWSADDRVYKLDVEWVLTVNYMFSDHIWIYGV